MTPTAEQLDAFAGRVISEHPYVKLLTAPKQFDGEWRALAIVNECLCLIAVNITGGADGSGNETV